jgi:hypothetical protein
VVWHHRRNSVKAYWRQQCGYGKAEAMLERKWPAKYNAVGHPAWAGRIYASYLTQMISVGRRQRIYHGTWCSALFQSAEPPVPGVLRSLVMMPEWYLLLLVAAALAGLGVVWRPLLFVSVPLLALAIGAPLVHAWLSALAAPIPAQSRTRARRLRYHALTAALHLLQPLARLRGRLRAGLTPWRRRATSLALPRSHTRRVWTGRWQPFDARLHALEAALQAQEARVRRGGDYDRWELEVHGGLFGLARLLMTVEEHGQGRQLTRVRAWPRYSAAALSLTLVAGVLALEATFDGSRVASVLLATVAVLVAARAVYESAGAMGALLRAVDTWREDDRAA